MKTKYYIPALLVFALSFSAVGSRLMAASQGPVFRLEEMKSYIYAEDRIPGFREALRPDESYIFNPIPAQWKDISLDGKWKISLSTNDGEVNPHEISETYGPLDMKQLVKPGYDFSKWEDTDVPWALCYKYRSNTYTAYYSTEFEAPSFSKGAESVFIKFHGAGYRSDIWVNGKYVGKHLGCFVPFEFNITDNLVPGKKTRLLVKTVNTMASQGWLPVRDGIFAPVRLQVRDTLHVSKLKINVNAVNSAVDVKFSVYPGPKGNRIRPEKIGGIPASTPALEPVNPRMIRVKYEATVEEAATGKVCASVSGTASGAENTISMKMDKPHYWSPEDPFLYYLRIKLDGKPESVTRFGYRTIEIKKDSGGRERIYLNGKKFYMRAFQYNGMASFKTRMKLQDSSFCINYKGRLREELLALKFANVNTVRPHSAHNFYDETFYNLCDELGILVYFDWNGRLGYSFVKGGQDGRIDSLITTLPAFVETLEYLHNHPSLSFFSFGNERYDWGLPPGVSYNPILAEYYDTQKKYDLQKRPASGSTGRPVYEYGTKVDFVDHHQYTGIHYGTHEDVVNYLRRTPEQIKKCYGEYLPFVNMEAGDVSDFRLHEKNLVDFGSLFKAEKLDRDAYLKTLFEKTEYDLRGWARGNLNQGGMRLYITDMPAFRDRKSYMVDKKFLEDFRTNCDYNDGISMNTGQQSLFSLMDAESWVKDRKAVQPWPEDGKLTITQPIYAFRTAFYPLQAFALIENSHILCGASSKMDIMIVNNSESDATFNMKIFLRDPAGKALEILSREEITLPQGEKTEMPLRVQLPLGGATGRNTLEIYLYNDKGRIAENYYYIYSRSAKDRLTAFPSKKTALYDTSAPKIGGGSTKAILDFLRIKYTLISGFSRLDDYKVLIIGADSLDSAVTEADSRIREWISKGGRMLVFEQKTAGPVPGTSGETVLKYDKTPFVEIYLPKHEIFRGVEDDMAWYEPAGHGGAVFENCLELNNSFLTLASVGHMSDPEGVKSVIDDRKSGKGEYLVSMVLTADRFNSDCTVTRYVENLLGYILSDKISPYAAEPVDYKAIKIPALEKADAGYIDLRAQANRGFSDETQGDRKGGWADYGAASDFRSLENNTGVTSFSGRVPYDIIDPAKNGGNSCIVLKGPKRDYFPAESGEIPVNQKYEKLYFLHTLMYVDAAEGDTVLEYVITYDDGRQVTFSAKNKVDIADWWAATSRENGQVVHRDGEKGLYSTEFLNPYPETAIKSINVRSTGKAIPIIIGITGKKKAAYNYY